MDPFVLTLVQGLLLVLLYLFVWRVARAVVRDLRGDTSARARRPGGTGTSAPPDAPPRELVVNRPDGTVRVLALNGQQISFGRAGPATVVLDDPFVSEQHATLRRDGQRWVLVDVGSTNGTFLNRRVVDGPTAITPGDEIGIGRTTVKVRS